MRIKTIRLKNYKRFTDLCIQGIPEETRLVVLVGPNGSGKSSLFDAFLHKSRGWRYNHRLNDAYGGYYVKDETLQGAPDTTGNVWSSIQIEIYNRVLSRSDWKSVFNVRSAYRNESDFRIDAIQRVQPLVDTVRYSRIIDPDQSVSDNYRRLTWKRLSDLDSDLPPHTTVGEYRKTSLGSLQSAMKELFPDPQLQLGNFGGTTDPGAFRFTKGLASNFLYKNLSGGEKAAFDVLLDVFVSREEYSDSVYCIDEPEAHMATALHGPLLQCIWSLVPEESQIWIATHSVGFVRKAYELMKTDDTVQFLDFSGHDFDKPVTIEPCVPDRAFWSRIYAVALDDLATLVAPKEIVICEGRREESTSGFDAQCYNILFADTHPSTVFRSGGGATQVGGTAILMNLLRSMAEGTSVVRLIDRDQMTDAERERTLSDDMRVLRRREIENYLFDPDVLATFLKEIGEEDKTSVILEHRTGLLDGESDRFGDVSKRRGALFSFIRKTVSHELIGNKPVEFIQEFLVPALRRTPHVLQELEDDVFGRKADEQC